jgi:Carboxypeptidase regulatory-like domain/TonB-dependent Receptor Plug Domain
VADRRLTCVVLLSAALLLATKRADGQEAAAGAAARISGVVFDSLAMRPLDGATVQLVEVPRATRARSVRTDTRGAFAFDSVGAGLYLLGFYHPLLDSLALPVPLTQVTVRVGGEIRAPLATPSAATLVRQLCGPQVQRDSGGAFLTFVRSAADGSGRSGADVRVSWSELSVTSDGIRRHAPSLQATTGEAGGAALCGVPVGAQVMARAWVAGDSSGFVELEMPPSGLLRRDLYIGTATVDTLRALSPDSQVVHTTVLRGPGTLRGTVRLPGGAPLAGARVGMWGSGLEAVTDEAGDFRITALPTGTFTVEARAIGFLPVRRPVDVRDGDDAIVELRLESMATYLDTVKVVAERIFTSRRMQEFESRRRSGFGYFLNDREIERRNPIYVADIMRMIPGVLVLPGRSASNVVAMRGMGMSTTCIPATFIDGVQVFNDDGDLDALVNVQDIQAVEVYTRGGSMPAQFQTLRGCGSIVIWTGGRSPLPRR